MSDYEEESEQEYDEEVLECDECGRELDLIEAEQCDGFCYDCDGSIRINRLRERLPPHISAREVTGNHRKPCSCCGKGDWFHGDWYIFNSVQPWGTDKYCLDCAENKDWDDDSDPEAESYANYAEFMNNRRHLTNSANLTNTLELPRLIMNAYNNGAGVVSKRSAEGDGSNVYEPPTTRRRI